MDTSQLLSVVEALAAQSHEPLVEAPGLAFMARTTLHHAPFIVVHGVGAEDTVRAAMAAWASSVQTERSPVIPLQTGSFFGAQDLPSNMLLMRLVAPLLQFVERIDPSHEGSGVPWHLARVRSKLEQSQRSTVGALSLWGGSHLAARAGHLDPEAYAMDLLHTARATHIAPDNFRHYIDDTIAMVKELKAVHGTPFFVIHVDHAWLAGPEVFERLRAARRVLTHRRVAILMDWPLPISRREGELLDATVLAS